MRSAGRIDSEEIPLLDQDDDSSETSTFVSGSLGDTQMTTWSDVHDQKQGQAETRGEKSHSGNTHLFNILFKNNEFCL